MYLKNLAIDQEVTFCNRDHARKEFVSGTGTIQKLMKDHFGHKYAEIREEIEIDGKMQVRTHVVPVAAIDASEENLAKFKKWIVIYEEADEKFRMQERTRLEKLIESIFTKAVNMRIAAYVKRTAKSVIKANRTLATFRKYALGAPTKEFSDYPEDVVKAAIDGEVRKQVEERAQQEIANQ